MNRSPLARYKKELACCVPGYSRRKALLSAFQRSLVPFLEENAAPSYEDLVEAFGPPEHMAQSFLHVNPLSAPLPLKRHIAFILCFCLVIVCVLTGIFFSFNTPETGGVLSAPVSYPTEINDNQFFPIEEAPFTSQDYHWDQFRRLAAYLVSAHNTNSVPTRITIRYSEIQPTHVFEVPAGETITFSVSNACPGEHTISFSTSDGSPLSGTIQVFASREAIV